MGVCCVSGVLVQKALRVAKHSCTLIFEVAVAIPFADAIVRCIKACKALEHCDL